MANIIVLFEVKPTKAGMKKYLEERGIADFKTGQADQEFFTKGVTLNTESELSELLQDFEG